VLRGAVQLGSLCILPLAKYGGQHPAAQDGQNIHLRHDAVGAGLLRMLLPLQLAMLAELVPLPKLRAGSLTYVEAAVAGHQTCRQRLPATLLHIPDLFAALAPPGQVRHERMKVHESNMVLRELCMVNMDVVGLSHVHDGLWRSVQLL
jgi:hypothetical protein